MKYFFLLLVFSGLAFAQSLEPLGGCKTQEVFVPDGGLVCYWTFLNPEWSFDCYETGYCRCNPWPLEEAAVSSTDPIERLRQMLQKSPIRASLVSSAMRERLKVPEVVAKPAKEPEKEAAPK